MVNQAVPPQQIVRYGRQEMVQHEDTAVANVTVGDVVERTANGVQPHSTAASKGSQTYVAIADRSVGMEPGDGTTVANPEADRDARSQAYATGANVKFLAVSGGGVWLRLAAGASVTKGDHLVSAGDGTVRVLDVDGTAPDDDPGAVVAEAAEARDNTGGADAVFVRTEVSN